MRDAFIPNRASRTPCEEALSGSALGPPTVRGIRHCGAAPAAPIIGAGRAVRPSRSPRHNARPNMCFAPRAAEQRAHYSGAAARAMEGLLGPGWGWYRGK